MRAKGLTRAYADSTVPVPLGDATELLRAMTGWGGERAS